MKTKQKPSDSDIAKALTEKGYVPAHDTRLKGRFLADGMTAVTVDESRIWAGYVKPVCSLLYRWDMPTWVAILRRLREQHDFTAREMAILADCPDATQYNRIEAGYFVTDWPRADDVSFGSIIRIADQFDLSIDAIVNALLEKNADLAFAKVAR